MWWEVYCVLADDNWIESSWFKLGLSCDFLGSIFVNYWFWTLNKFVYFLPIWLYQYKVGNEFQSPDGVNIEIVCG